MSEKDCAAMHFHNFEKTFNVNDKLDDLTSGLQQFINHKAAIKKIWNSLKAKFCFEAMLIISGQYRPQNRAYLIDDLSN